MIEHILQQRTGELSAELAAGPLVVIIFQIFKILEDLHLFLAEDRAPGGQPIDLPGLLVPAHVVHQLNGVYETISYVKYPTTRFSYASVPTVVDLVREAQPSADVLQEVLVLGPADEALRFRRAVRD